MTQALQGVNEVDDEFAWRLYDKSPEAVQSWIEHYLTVPTEYGQIVDMRLYPQQVQMLHDETGRDVTVKGRQTRASSLKLARNVRSMTNGELWGATCVVGAQDDATTAIFRNRIKHHIFNDLNSNGFDFTARKDNDDELVLDVLENRFQFISGEMKTITRGYATQLVHLSEFAHWNNRTVFALVGGLLPAVPGSGRIDIESTPKGEEGAFYEYAMGLKEDLYNRWSTHLYPWWLEPRYTVSDDPTSRADVVVPPQVLDQLRREFVPDDREEMLGRTYDLTAEQLLWRRIKKREQDATLAPFLQEYPEDLDTCWLGNEGKYFDTPDGIDHLEFYRDARREPVRTFEKLTYRGAEVSFYGPNLAIWEWPDQKDTYVGAFDAAGGGVGKESDWAVVYIMSARKEKIVARLRIQASPKQLAAMCCAIGTFFNSATFSGERSHHGATVFEEMRDLGYRNLYYHVNPMKPPKRGERIEPGVYPTQENRLNVLEKFKAAVVGAALESFDSELVKEMNTFTWQKFQNRLRAQATDLAGLHDDCIFAAANCWFIIDKVRNRLKHDGQEELPELILQGRNNLVVGRGSDRSRQVWFGV